MSLKLSRRPLVILGCAAVAGLLLGFILQAGVEGFGGEEVEDVPMEAKDFYALPPQQDVLPEAALQGIPPYPNVDDLPRSLSRKLIAQGQPMEAAWFTTNDSVQTVLDFYASSFEDAGIAYVGDMFSESSGYVGYMGEAEEMHVVSVIRQGDKSVVFPSVGDPGKMLDGTAKVPDDVPVSKDAVSNVVLEFQDEGRTQQTISSTFATGTVDEVSRFYQEQFAQKGWKVAPMPQGEPNSAQLYAEQTGKSARITIRRDPSLDTGVLVFITLTRGAS